MQEDPRYSQLLAMRARQGNQVMLNSKFYSSFQMITFH